MHGGLQTAAETIMNVVKLHTPVMPNILVTLLNRFPVVFTDLSHAHVRAHSRYNHRYDMVTTPLIRAVKEMETEFF